MNFINKKHIPYYIIAALLLYILMIGKKEVVEVVIPSKTGSVQIINPKPEKEFDTIYIDTTDRKKGFRIVEVENPLNKELLHKYEEAVKSNDSLQAVKVFKEAIKERKYTERLEDSVQVIIVKSDVVGTLKRQLISYETKYQTVRFETGRDKPKVYVGTFLSVQTIENQRPAFGFQIQIANKKRVLILGVDTKKEIHVGYALKLF